MPLTGKKYCIMDIDGTLANVEHRLHHINAPKDSGRRSWKAFFDSAKDDQPYNHVLALNHLLNDSTHLQIVLLTGRPENLRADTEEWLNRHKVNRACLLMRPAKDNRPDYVVKPEVLQDFLDDRSETFDSVFCVFEDRLKVSKAWRELGLNVLLCGDEWLRQDWSE